MRVSVLSVQTAHRNLFLFLGSPLFMVVSYDILHSAVEILACIFWSHVSLLLPPPSFWSPTLKTWWCL